MEHIYHHSYDTVFKKCKEALSSLDIEINSANKEKGYIKASTGTSLFSWGEEIQIHFNNLSIKKTKVIVESKASAQAFAWGKNSKNVSSIFEELSNKLKV
jgi:hypothetical protein